MISIQQYRVTIGMFVPADKMARLNEDGIDCACSDELYEMYSHWSHAFLSYLKCQLLSEFGVYDHICFSLIKLKLLLRGGDVEIEPGPSNTDQVSPKFEKIVLGNFNQGDKRFESSAGKQCVAISLYAAAFATIKKIQFWVTDTLDSLLEYGDRFYRSLGSDKFLGVEDLPAVVPVFDTDVNVIYNLNTHGILNQSEIYKDILKETFLNNIQLNTSCLTWFSQSCIAIIFKRCAGQNTKYVVFDSHSKDKNGEIVANGTSSLITINQIENLIEYFLFNLFEFKQQL